MNPFALVFEWYFLGITATGIQICQGLFQIKIFDYVYVTQFPIPLLLYKYKFQRHFSEEAHILMFQGFFFFSPARHFFFFFTSTENIWKQNQLRLNWLERKTKQLELLSQTFYSNALLHLKIKMGSDASGRNCGFCILQLTR